MSGIEEKAQRWEAALEDLVKAHQHYKASKADLGEHNLNQPSIGAVCTPLEYLTAEAATETWKIQRAALQAAVDDAYSDFISAFWAANREAGIPTHTRFLVVVDGYEHDVMLTSTGPSDVRISPAEAPA